MERLRLQYITGCLAALLFAALLPAFIVAAMARSLSLVPIAFGVALAHGILLGLPFAIFWPKRWINALSCTAVGLVVGALPSAVLTWPLSYNPGTSASVDGVATIVAGVPTVAGWINYLQFLLYLASFGALAGFTFWIVLKRSGALAQGNAGKPNSSAMGPSLVLAAVALLLTGGVVAVPTILEDRTCHNLLRDGRRSIGPQVVASLQLELEDWPILTKVVEEFGVKHGLSYRNSSSAQPEVVQVLDLSLCNEQGAAIQLMEQRWASSGFPPSVPRGGVFIGVYQVGSASGWEQLARDFVAEIETDWPGKMQFEDRNGRIVGKPPELQ